MSQPTVEEDAMEATGENTSADDTEKGAVVRSSEIEEVEVVRLDNSSSDQAEEEPAEKTTSEAAADEVITGIVSSSSGHDAASTVEETPISNPSECARRTFACLTCSQEVTRLCERCTLQLRSLNPRQEEVDLLVAASDEGRQIGRRFVCMAENAGLFFFAFEIGFNQCMKKAKEYFPNLDTDFLTLTDIDGNTLMADIMNADPCTFISAASTFADEMFGLTGPSSDGEVSDLAEARRAACRSPGGGGETSDGRDRRTWPPKPPKGRRSLRKKH